MPTNNLINKLWSLFTKSNKPPQQPLIGQAHGVGTPSYRNYGLPISQVPFRAVQGDIKTSLDLLEIKTWCYEARHAVSAIARDAFQQIDGRISSWDIAEEIKVGSEVYKVHPDVIAIGREVANRTKAGEYILGGDSLKRAASDSLHLGDGFLELAYDREGISRNDWYISDAQFLPSYTMFVEEGDSVYSYRQQVKPIKTVEDTLFYGWQIIQFTFDKDGLYGIPINLQAIDNWLELKESGFNLHDAAKSVGVAPWLHIMPEGKEDDFRATYQKSYEAALDRGIIANLFLLNGADVRKAGATTGAITSLMDHHLSLRYKMIPPGVPLWLFPGLGLESSAGKDIANQPALAYARLINDVRSMVGKGIKKAIAFELILKKGPEWFAENGRFDIVWGDWFVTGFEQGVMDQGEDEDSSDTEDKPDKKSSKKDGEDTEDSYLYLKTARLSSNGHSVN